MLLTLAFITEHYAFGRRCDKNPNLKYYSAEDFGLSAESVSLQKGLRGYLYRKNGVPQMNKLIIFCHGMGPGHVAYTTEIAYFCGLGYPVLAVDSLGCGLSAGKGIRGMYSGVRTVLAAIDGCNYSSVYLVGHSWGAYSALCASSRRKVAGVVAISAPDTPSKTMRDAAAPKIKRPLAVMLRPFWWIVNFLKYGAAGNISAARSAKKNGTPTLLIHGDADKTVLLSGSAFAKAEGDNITRLLAEGKAHNPYNTLNAEKLLSELSGRIARGEKDFSDFDFASATEEDKGIMAEIAEFIKNN